MDKQQEGQMRVRGNQREKGVRDRQVGWEGQLNWAESSGAPERKAEPGRNPCRRWCLPAVLTGKYPEQAER